MIRHVCNGKVYLHRTELFIHRYFISIFGVTVMYGVCTYSPPGVVFWGGGVLASLHCDGLIDCSQQQLLHSLNNTISTVYRFVISSLALACHIPYTWCKCGFELAWMRLWSVDSLKTELFVIWICIWSYCGGIGLYRTNYDEKICIFQKYPICRYYHNRS